MSLSISGQLVLPNGTQAANAEIYFTAVRTSQDNAEVITGSRSVNRCDAQGNYSINIEYGRYQIATRISTPEPVIHGSVTISSDIVAKDLEDLITLISADGNITDELLERFSMILSSAEDAADRAEKAADTAAEETAQKVGLMFPVNSGNWSDVAGSQLTEQDRYKAWSYPDGGDNRYAVRGNVTLPITIPDAPDEHFYLASAVNVEKMRSDAASQLGQVYSGEWSSGIAIPADAMKNKLVYWHNGQFYNVGTNTGFNSNDFDVDFLSGKFVATSLYTVNSIANLNGRAGGSVIVMSYHNISPLYERIGGGLYIYNPNAVRSSHNGGTIIDPTKVYPSNWSDSDQVSEWLSGSNSGNGCWLKADINIKACPEDFGCFGDKSNDDTVQLEKCLSFAASRKILVDCYPSRTYLTNQNITINPTNQKFVINGNGSEIWVSKDINSGQSYGLEIHGRNLKLRVNDFNVNASIRGGNIDDVGAKITRAFYVWGVDDVIFDGCDVTEVMGTGYEMENCARVLIKNYNLTNVWGSKTSQTGPEFDNYGDGIHFNNCRNASSSCGTIKSLKPARGGIVYEFNCNGGSLEDISIEGYDRNLHLEGSISNITATQNIKLSKCHIAVALVHNVSKIRINADVDMVSSPSGSSLLTDKPAPIWGLNTDDVTISGSLSSPIQQSSNLLYIDGSVASKGVKFIDFSINGSSVLGQSVQIYSTTDVSFESCSLNNISELVFNSGTNVITVKDSDIYNTVVRTVEAKRFIAIDNRLSGTSYFAPYNVSIGSKIKDNIGENISSTVGAMIDNYTTLQGGEPLEISGNTLSYSDASLTAKIVKYDNGPWFSAAPNAVVNRTGAIPVVTKEEKAWV